MGYNNRLAYDLQHGALQEKCPRTIHSEDLSKTILILLEKSQRPPMKSSKSNNKISVATKIFFEASTLRRIRS